MGNVMGSVSGLGGVMAGVGNIRQIIDGVAGSITLDRGGVSTLLQGLVGNLNTTLTRAEQLSKGAVVSGSAGNEVVKAFQADLTRLAYVAALEKAVKKARGTGPFNVETAINDLWVALDGVRHGQQATVAQVQNSADVIQSITTILKQMNDAAGQAIQNIK